MGVLDIALDGVYKCALCVRNEMPRSVVINDFEAGDSDGKRDHEQLRAVVSDGLIAHALCKYVLQ